MRTLLRLVAVSLPLLAGCSSGGGGGASVPKLGDASAANATLVAGTAAATCPGGSEACGTSGWCCPTGTICGENNANDALGCGASNAYCCLGCTAGAPCGGGCCASGTSCVGNPGDATACGTALCCSPTPDEACPTEVAAQCATGTRCLKNRSARYCSSGFACYLPTGQVGCPGEVLCDNAIDFCGSGQYCAAVSGVCTAGSTSGNYCCKTYALGGQSCDSTLCAPGLTCMTNPHCADSDQNATKTCHGSCAGQVQCGNYCCPSGETCNYTATCSCWL